ncbi:hypothetical protein, partial [Thermogutta sp.]|uniref:hypothetical protein n=1 Tax=Thermogutta sp. TaxID=1962930 RepID=UPI00321FCB91
CFSFEECYLKFQECRELFKKCGPLAADPFAFYSGESWPPVPTPAPRTPVKWPPWYPNLPGPPPRK